jgi:hypothetical protein
MSIDYVIHYPCIIRKHISNTQLLAITTQRSQALQLLAFTMIEQEKTEEEARNKIIKIKLFDENNQAVKKEVKIGELLDQTDVIDKLRPACKDCPVSKGIDFGCFGQIHFPISRNAEQWLIELLKKLNKKGLPDSILINVIQDNNVSGKKFSDLRQGVSHDYFESKVQYSLSIKKSLLKKSSINTNQLFEAFFGKETLDIADLLYIGFFSGGLQIIEEKPENMDAYTAYFQTKSKDGKEVYYLYQSPEYKGDDSTIKELQTFFNDVFLAMSKGSVLKVSYQTSNSVL